MRFSKRKSHRKKLRQLFQSDLWVFYSKGKILDLLIIRFSVLQCL